MHLGQGLILRLIKHIVMRSEFYNEIENSRKRFMDDIRSGRAHVIPDPESPQNGIENQENDGMFKDGSDISGLRDKDTMNLKQQGSSQGRRAINEDSEIKAKSRLASLKNYFLQKSISFFDYEEAER